MLRRCTRLARHLADDRGASPVEFVMVGMLLTLVTLAVLQLGLAVYVRNILHDAAVDGAFHGALADSQPRDGADRTRDIIVRTIGQDYAGDVSARSVEIGGDVVVEVTVRAPFPAVGLLGIREALEVTAHAPVESLG